MAGVECGSLEANSGAGKVLSNRAGGGQEGVSETLYSRSGDSSFS